MGQPEQFAKRTFALETASLTRGAIAWKDPPEISLTKVQSDGMLLVVDPTRLPQLGPPWEEARPHEEVQIEVKMAGDHIGVPALERLLLRRQARQVERVEADKVPWRGQVPVWAVAPHVPEVLRETRDVRRFAPGCYRIEPAAFSFIWIAANELPLRDDLVPFLVARSGSALDEFGRWVATRRPIDWVLDMVQFTAMSMLARAEVIRTTHTDDPAVEERRLHLAKLLLEDYPELVTKARDEGHVVEARSALRRVLARRGLVLSPIDDARIETCTDLAALERWHDDAVVAPSAAEALRS